MNIEYRLDCNINLKTPEELDIGMITFTTGLHEAARLSTPFQKLQRDINRIHLGIKQLLKEKGRVRPYGTERIFQQIRPVTMTSVRNLKENLKKCRKHRSQTL